MSWRALSLVALLSTLFASPEVFSQATTTYQDKNLNIKPLEAQQPDLTGLWYHINQKQIALANDEYARLKEAYPNWRVSQELLEAIKGLNEPDRPQKIVKTDKAPKAKPETVELKPKSEITKPNPAAPLEAFAALTPKARASTSNEKVKRLAALSNSLNRPDFYLLMGWTALDKNLLEIAKTQFENAQKVATLDVQKQSILQGLNSIKGIHVERALVNMDLTLITRYLNQDNQGYVMSIIEGNAWKNYDNKEYDKALSLFSLLNNNEGQYATLVAQNNADDVFKFACSISTEIFLRRCADALAERQVRFFEESEYSKSIDAAKQLSEIRPLTIDEQELVGWAAKENQDIATATSAFEVVLSKKPDNEVIANELVVLNKGDNTALARLALKYSVIKTRLQRESNQNAWPRKQFWYAYSNDDERVVNAQTKDAFTVLYGTNVRNRSGQRGLGHFDVFSHYVGIGSAYKKWLWQVTLDYKQFYSGSPNDGDWFGDRQLANLAQMPFEGISGFEDTGVRAEVSYQDSKFNVYANLEYGMFSQPVDTKVTGQLSATRFFSDTIVALTLFRKAKDDSLLSQTGTFNAQHNLPWGYVIENGARALVAHVFAPKWSVAGTAQLSSLKGERVKDNGMWSLSAYLNYDLAESDSPYLDYWRVGPFASYSTYDHNLSGFTYGNGGYFSPRYFVSIGGYSELLTLEAMDWQVKLRTALALSRLEQQDELRFPLGDFFAFEDDAATRLDYDKTTGLSGNIMAEGQYRIDDNWILSGYIGKAFAVEFQSFEAGLQIRWRGGQGTGVTSDELILSSPRRTGFAL